MNKFTPRIPNYVDRACFPDEYLEQTDFNKFEELLEMQFIKDKMAWKDFERFSRSDNLLMAEATSTYRVIGFFKNPDDVDLPLFNDKKYTWICTK